MSDTQTIYAAFGTKVDAALVTLEEQGVLPAGTSRSNVAVEPPRDPAHGDLATNAAMVLAKQAKTNPRELAGHIAGLLEADPAIVSAEIAGPGFINLRLDRAAWLAELSAIAAAGAEYGRSTMGAGQRVNVEYVSANPTGPMHMGHCRGAVVGDALASLLEFAGHEVAREYYINDAGGQVDVLARSAHLRYREALGEDIGPIPEGLYPGEYLIPAGQALAEKYGDQYRDAAEADWLTIFRRASVSAMMDMIKADLALLGVHHDVFASEYEVQQSGAVDRALDVLDDKGYIYNGVLEAPKGKVVEDWEPTELLLFRSTEFGDDQDRPVKKSDGSWTYFAADTAYHLQKLESSDALIDVWGADHAGTVKRTKAAVSALTDGRAQFDVKLVQMVHLMRGGEPVKMSKRSGNFITIADMVGEVGKDVVRFTMLTRKPEAQMEFDFAKVIEASKDNPVFYVQYAHARISSTLRKGAAEGLEPSTKNLDLLGDEELELIKLAAQFPRQVEAAAGAREAHRIAFYLYDLAGAFHAYWNLGNDQPDKRFILSDNGDMTGARLFLGQQIGQIIRNGLNILGVEAVEEM